MVITDMDEVVKSRSDTERETIKVLHAGYLPGFGSVKSHPLFYHFLANPPPGYEFVYVGAGILSGIDRLIAFVTEALLFPGTIGPKLNVIMMLIKERNIRSRLQRCFRPESPLPRHEFVHTRFGNLWGVTRLIASVVNLLSSAIENGAKLREVIMFILTRNVLSQLRIPTNARLVFVPGFPYILGQVPWVIEIEDAITLFAPFVSNGKTSSLEIFDAPYYPSVKALVESASCRGIICHVKSTAENLPLLFKNDVLRKKITYIPFGIQLPRTLPSREKREDDVIRILFTNSWHQQPRNFYLRGGLDLLEAFSILASRYPNVRLILRTALPPDLDSRYQRIIQDYPIELVDEFLPTNDMEELLSHVDIYVLPSARIHVVSILEAMAHGLAVVVSDGWGITEYVEHYRNGLVVRGRYGKCSWMDVNGMLREDYSPLFASDPLVVSGLVDSLSTLIEDRELCERLGQAARKDIETKFSFDNWNRGLKKVFDQALL